MDIHGTTLAAGKALGRAIAGRSQPESGTNVAGFSRANYPMPVRYPVACHPQAWAAGAVPYMTEAILGLTPNALDGCLRICRPVLPDSVRWLEVRNLRVGNGAAALRFERTDDGTANCTVVQVKGELDVIVEHGSPELS